MQPGVQQVVLPTTVQDPLKIDATKARLIEAEFDHVFAIDDYNRNSVIDKIVTACATTKVAKASVLIIKRYSTIGGAAARPPAAPKALRERAILLVALIEAC